MKMRIIGIRFAFALALLISAYAIVQFIVFSPKSAGTVKLLLLDVKFPYKQSVPLLYLHIVGSAIALAVGPLLFSTRCWKTLTACTGLTPGYAGSQI